MVGSTRTLDSHACRLRTKLAIEGDKFVLNVWGVGYRLVEPIPLEGDDDGSAPGGAGRHAAPGRRRMRHAAPQRGVVA